MNYLYNILFYYNIQYGDYRQYGHEDDKEYDRDEVNQYWNRLDIVDIYIH
jgi:hypothetical protein